MLTAGSPKSRHAVYEGESWRGHAAAGRPHTRVHCRSGSHEGITMGEWSMNGLFAYQTRVVEMEGGSDVLC